MDYSPVISRMQHPLLEPGYQEDEEDASFQKIMIEEEDHLAIVDDIYPLPSSNKSSGGFFRRSKSKPEELKADLGSPSKKSSPIEIKGSPGHHKSNGKNNKEKTVNNNSSSSGGRMSFLKVLTRRSSTTNQGKHKKMSDSWMGNSEPVLDGVAFCVKFLGSTLIEKTGAAEAAEATKTVIQMSKAGQKSTRIGLSVSTNGITLSDPSTGEIRMEISIYDIAHCSADSNYPNVFSFIATNKNDVNECYCFATRKRKMAKHITLTIAQAFNVAFELWQNSSMENCGSSGSSGFGSTVDVILGSSDSCKSNASTGSEFRDWVAFDHGDEKEDLESQFDSMSLVTLSPFHKSNGQLPPRIKQPPPSGKVREDHLLICLN